MRNGVVVAWMRTAIAVVWLIAGPVASGESRSRFLYLDEESSHPVIEYDPQNDDHNFEVSTRPRVVVFYSAYCGHCISFKKVFVKLARETTKYVQKGVEFHAVSCLAYNEICRRYAIRGYPSTFFMPPHTNNQEQMIRMKRPQLKPEWIAQTLTQTTTTTTTSGSNSQNDKDNYVDEEEGHEGELENEVQVPRDSALSSSSDDEQHQQQQQQQRLTEENGEVLQHDHAPGANRAKALGNAYQKRFKESAWKNYIEKRQSLRKHVADLQQRAPEGATDSMRSYQYSTDAYMERRRNILDTIQKKHGRQFRHTLENKWKLVENSKGNMTQLPFRKEVSKPRMAERVPLIPLMMNLGAMTKEEELILDVSLAFLEGLKYGVYTDEKPLSLEKKIILARWFDLMSMALPEEWGLHVLVEKLKGKIEFIGKDRDSLMKILNTHHMERSTWSSSCALGQFNCGFWKLLHTVTLGVAEHRGGQTLIDSGLRKSASPVFSPLFAADVIRDYMKEFFLCEDCSEHFVATYSDCSNNRRCDRLSDVAARSTEADWKQLAVWLWEFHNDVSVRLAKSKPDGSAAEDANSVLTMAVLWPDMDSCWTCFNPDASWNEDAIFLHLEAEYWPSAKVTPKMNRILVFDKSLDPEGSHLMKVLVVAVLAMAAYLLYTVRKDGLQQTIIRAKKLAPKSASSFQKQSL